MIAAIVAGLWLAGALVWVAFNRHLDLAHEVVVGLFWPFLLVLLLALGVALAAYSAWDTVATLVRRPRKPS